MLTFLNFFLLFQNTNIARAESLTYYKDIKAIITLKCAGCHSTGGLAPFELETYAQVLSRKKSIRREVENKSMPPWIAESGHQDYKDDLSLSVDEISKVVTWIDQGAIEGLPEDYKEPQKSVFISDVSVPIFQDHGSYLPNQDSSDDYRCFLIPIEDQLKENNYITGFSGIPGNSKIVHHLVAYYVRSEILSTLIDLDKDEPGRGYQCFGGALPDRLGTPEVRKALEEKNPGIVEKLYNDNYWLAHWAPGMEMGYSFPEGTGVIAPKGGGIVIQVHYYTEDAKLETDQNTYFNLQLSKNVKKPGFFFPLTNGAWLFGKENQSMVIPAKSSAQYSVETSLQNIASYGKYILNLPSRKIKNIELHSANLHMHSIGSNGNVTLNRSDLNQSEVLLNINEWDLHWQRDFQFLSPKIIPFNDASLNTLKVSCAFENPNDFDVFGGFGSMDEMCFDFSFFAFDLDSI